MGENMQISPSKMKTICIPLLLGEDKKIELDISVVD